jgi:hypothetical protein
MTNSLKELTTKYDELGIELERQVVSTVIIDGSKLIQYNRIGDMIKTIVDLNNQSLTRLAKLNLSEYKIKVKKYTKNFKGI